MAIQIEISERHRYHLGSLLKIKKANEGREVKGLREEILDAVSVMDEKDVAYVEKIFEVKAL